MKKIILTCTAIILSSVALKAQTESKPFQIGGYAGLADYHREKDQNWFNTGKSRQENRRVAFIVRY